MSGTEVFSYSFTDAVTGDQDVVSVTVDSTPSNTTGSGPSYAVTDISGNVAGSSFDQPIANGGTVTNSDGIIYDNAIFQNAGDGVSGNIDGIDNDGLDFTSGGVEYNIYDDNGVLVIAHYDSSGTFISDPITVESTDAPCFCAGTMIRTDRGEVAVEALAIGDTVTTVDGTQQAIRWIGRRAVATRFANPTKSIPVRIKAGALDEASPSRDTLMSPCHAVLVDGILVQAGALVNGTSIVHETAMPETFTYYHIELADHALILADGVASETFVDNTDRRGFDNWAEHEALFGGTVEIAEMAHPRAKSMRQVPATLRARLAARAAVGMTKAA